MDDLDNEECAACGAFGEEQGQSNQGRERNLERLDEGSRCPEHETITSFLLLKCLR